MDIDSFFKELDKQIAAGKELTSRIDSLKATKTSARILNVAVCYDSSMVYEILNSIDRWQKLIITVLESSPSKSAEFKKNFEDTIVGTKEGFDPKKEMIKEVDCGVSCLISIKERLSFIGDISEIKEVPNLTSCDKEPMVFISHSKNDESFVKALVDLLEFIGIKGSNMLFCSSVKGYQIPTSKNIFGYLREIYLTHRLFVIFVQSHNFFGSPVSLNEMGAAWALKTDFCSILPKDFEYDDMKGVVGNGEISIKVDEKDANAKLNDLKDRLISFFKLSQVEASRWEEKRDDCLKDMCSYTLKV